VYVPLIAELEAPTASVAIGFPVIVNPIIGSVTTTLVGLCFSISYSKVYVITSPTLPVPPTAAVFTSAILVLSQ
jgi:hypothetical protein